MKAAGVWQAAVQRKVMRWPATVAARDVGMQEEGIAVVAAAAVVVAAAVAVAAGRARARELASAAAATWRKTW